MTSAKEIEVRPIAKRDADALIRRVHYSGKVVRNSQLSLGVFLHGRLEGAMQFGPSLDKTHMLGLVRDTNWNGFLELNRMAFTDVLPRNSESRALGIAMRMIRKNYPHIEWIVSFADACQCGEGTIYRAAGFVLTLIKQNKDVMRFAEDVASNRRQSAAAFRGYGRQMDRHRHAAGGAHASLHLFSDPRSTEAPER